MTSEIESSQARTQKLEGLGTRRKRVEDIRFTQGKGNYVDDFKFPGMLFGDFVRSPYGHARVKSIKKEAAIKLPGVKAVLTAEDLRPLKLHWMPTLAGDVQAVLADGKVVFQGQEVAFVVAGTATSQPTPSTWSRSITKSCRPSSLRPGQWPRTRLFCATTSKTKPVERTVRASIPITSLPGRLVTPREPCEPWRKPRLWPRSKLSTSASILARWKPAAASPRWTR
jgi:hypothetical protein